jgi:hypothetical protein
MTTYRFREVKRSAQRRLKCRSCGKRFSRSRTFTQTINPFNKNADGDPKTYAEIWKELGIEAEVWQPADLCTNCGELEPSNP